MHDEKECKGIFNAKKQEEMEGNVELGANKWENRIIYEIRSRKS